MSISRRRQRVAAVAAMAIGVVLVIAPPAYAAALTSVSWSTSQPQPGSTGVRYTWTFTTATTGTIGSVSMTVPAGTGSGTLAVADRYGIGAGTLALAANTLTYTVTSPLSIAAGTPILISIDDFTNTTTAGTSSSTVTTVDNVGPATIDTAASNDLTISASSTAVTVVVARSTAFISDTTDFVMLMDPSVPALATQTRDVNLTVRTNAVNGYTLNTKIETQQLYDGSTTLPAVPGTVAAGVASPAANTFGYSIPSSTGGTVQGQLATRYAGYDTAGETVGSNSAATNGDTYVLRNQAKIDHAQPTGTYQGSITYAVLPSY